MFLSDQVLTHSLTPLKILACIVTYNGADCIRETLSAILAQSRKPDKILILDNGSSDNTVALVRQFHSPAVETHVFSENRGVATAYNYALEYARHDGFSGLWLFDQDTLCEINCLGVLESAAMQFQTQNVKIAALFPVHRLHLFPETILFPNLWNGKRLTNSEPLKEGEPIREVHTSMTSGTLYIVTLIETNEWFREDFFIDFVDHEFHLRLRKKGYRFYWVQGAQVSHSLGQAAEVQGYGVVIWHSPNRYYYMGRNMTWCYKHEGGWKAVVSLLSDAREKYGQLKAAGIENTGLMRRRFFSGVLDGLLNRFRNPINPD